MTLILNFVRAFWLFPSFSRVLPTNVDTQLLLAQLHDGRVAAVLPLTTHEYMGTLRGSSSRSVVARFERDALPVAKSATAKIAVTIGVALQDVVRDVVRALRSIRSPYTPIKSFPEETSIFSGTLT